MASSRQLLETVLFLAAFQLGSCFVRLDATATPPENPTKGYVENISLLHLTDEHLSHISPDVAYLKISHSKIGAIRKNAFDRFKNLNLLEISDCEIYRELDPQTLSRLPGLEILVLQRAGLRRVRLNLTNVQEVVLSGNEMEAFDGRAVVGKNVNFLDLSGNNLKALTGSFGNMSKLSMIDISKNKIGEVPPVFRENEKLLRILASGNKLKTTDGLNLPWLRTLDLFENEIEELHPDSFLEMESLEELVLAFNRIQHIDDAFKDLVELKFLNLAWNHIKELHPNLFRNNPYLTKLYLQGNEIGELEAFQNVLPHLTHLDVSHNQILKVDRRFFRWTPALQVLNLSFNRLKALGDILMPLSDLKILNLAYNHIPMTGNELSWNRQLIRVNLSTNGLREGLSLFRNNNLLAELDLSGNEISDFCDGNVSLKSLLKVNLKGNQIKSLNCLKELSALCQVDLRDNPVACGQDLDDLILSLAKRKSSPFGPSQDLHGDVPSDQCENLSENKSFSLWNTIKRELCPNGGDVEPQKGMTEVEEWESGEAENVKEPAAESIETKEKLAAPQETQPQKKEFIHLPLGWIKNDEMHKPNPLQNPQSGRLSWGTIDENSELLNGFEDEEIEKRPRFSWYTIALILIGLSLTLTCFNLVVFLYIRLKVWKRTEMSSPQKYTALHNEVYKNTTQPSQVMGGEDWSPETRNKIFSYGRINGILLNFGLSKKEKDSESMKNILVHSTSNSQNF